MLWHIVASVGQYDETVSSQLAKLKTQNSIISVSMTLKGKKKVLAPLLKVIKSTY